MDLLIRAVQANDAEAIVGILNPIIESGIYSAFDTPFTAETERAFISDFPERGVFHAAVRCQDQKIVGFHTLEPFATYSHAFDHVGVIGTFVELGLRRQGIATHLFNATFEAARKKGYEKIFTFVRADNLTALTSYLKQGFRIVGTAQKHTKIKENYIDEIIIEKFL